MRVRCDVRGEEYEVRIPSVPSPLMGEGEGGGVERRDARGPSVTQNRLMVIGSLLLLVLTATVLPAQSGQGAPPHKAHGSPRAVIRVKRTATVQGKEILLKDIAEITASSGSLAEALEALPVGQAPPPGLTRTFDPELIVIKLRQYKIDPTGIQIESSGAVVIAGAHRVIGSDEIFQAAKSAVLRGREGELDQITVRLDTLPSDLVVPPGEIELRAKPRLTLACPEPCRMVGLGSIPVMVEAWVDGRLYRTVSLTLRLLLMREVVVASYPLPRHGLVKATDVRLERRDIGMLTQEPLADLALAVGRRTTRMLAMGAVVASDAVELPPLIQKGDVVTLMVESPGLLVMTKGIAQEVGKVGQLVRVKNTASGREILGKVENSKTIRVGL